MHPIMSASNQMFFTWMFVEALTHTGMSKPRVECEAPFKDAHKQQKPKGNKYLLKITNWCEMHGKSFFHHYKLPQGISNKKMFRTENKQIGWTKCRTDKSSPNVKSPGEKNHTRNISKQSICQTRSSWDWFLATRLMLCTSTHMRGSGSGDHPRCGWLEPGGSELLTLRDTRRGQLEVGGWQRWRLRSREPSEIEARRRFGK